MAAETDAVNMWLYEGVGTFGAPYLSYAPGGGTREVRRFDEDRINGRTQRPFVSSLTRALPASRKMFTSRTIGTRQGNRQLVHFS